MAVAPDARMGTVAVVASDAQMGTVRRPLVLGWGWLRRWPQMAGFFGGVAAYRNLRVTFGQF